MRLLLVLAICFLSGCGQESAAPRAPGASSLPQVYTVNYPLAWAAQHLAGDQAEVHFPAPAGVDPAFWEPDLATIAAYQGADLILLNGAGYAKWIAEISLPRNRLLDTSGKLQDQLIAVTAAAVHSHGPSGDHSHGDTAFTTWLDLSLFGQQVTAVEQGLSRLITVDAAGLAARIQNWHEALSVLGQKLNGAPILYSHPVYQYLDRAYGFNGQTLHWEPREYPSPDQWQALTELLEQHRAQLMLFEAEPLAKTRARLAELGIAVSVFQPMGNRPAEGDFSSVMNANIDSLSNYLDSGAP
jgi:zinc transport system substrate-binding protein